VNNIWLKASQRLTRVWYRRVVFLSVTEITGAPQWRSALATIWPVGFTLCVWLLLPRRFWFIWHL